MRTLLLSLLVLGLSACAAGPKTASGRPELLVDLSPQQAKAQVVEAWSASGFQIERSDDMGVNMVKPLDAFQEAMIGRGAHQIRFNFIPQGKGTMIRATSYIAATSGTTETSTAKAGAQIQESLESIFQGHWTPAVAPEAGGADDGGGS